MKEECIRHRDVVEVLFQLTILQSLVVDKLRVGSSQAENKNNFMSYDNYVITCDVLGPPSSVQSAVQGSHVGPMAHFMKSCKMIILLQNFHAQSY